MNNKIDILFTFDTTGSMYPCIHEVRQKVEDTTKNLFKEIVDLRIAITAHGDYCDERTTYVTKTQPFSNNSKTVSEFVKNVGRTGGGDADECYELVLNQAKSLDWRDDAQKVIVMIGDAEPHEPAYTLNKNRLNWRTEAKELGAKGIQIYSVQCLYSKYNTSAESFYKQISQLSNGIHLKLAQFNQITQLIYAIAYKQDGTLDKYEEDLKSKGLLNRSIAELFDTLQNRKKTVVFAEAGLEVVEPSRFQVLTVTADKDIRSFVEETGADFKKGAGFYQFTKSELIQERKDVVLVDKVTGDMFTGDHARELIGLPKGERAQLKPAKLEKYDVYVQSTSINRKLKGGTKFLYDTAK